MTVGERIKAAREAKVWGQAELAKAAGISPNTLWRIENGQHSPRPATIRRIAEALGIQPAELVRGTEPTELGEAKPGESGRAA